jgi:thiamine-monophosphate kinase
LLSTADSGPRPGEIHLGDDAAVLGPLPAGHQLVLCSDVAVAGVHGDLSLISPEDLGWRAAAACLSDLAAMGAVPLGMLASAVLPATAEPERLLGGVIEAAQAFGCPLVGGDLSSGTELALDVAATGTLPAGSAMRRDRGRAGDTILVTGPLGASAAGLRGLRSGRREGAVIEAHEGDFLAALHPQAGLQMQRDILQPQLRAILDADRSAAICWRGEADAPRGEPNGFIGFGFAGRT